MLTEHLRSESLTMAMENTFDGQHPCKLCCAIRAAKKAEKKTEFPVSLKKMEFPPPASRIVLYAPTTFALLYNANTFADFPVLSPPTPPPRAALA
jgi:hypothetical protein